MRSFASYGWFALSLLLKIPAMLRINFWKKRHPGQPPNGKITAFIYREVKNWANSLVWVTGARLRIRGEENIPKDKTVLFVSNHQSDFDIVVFLAAVPLPIGFVAKIELLRVPLLRTWMKHIRCVFIDRKDMKQTAKTILEGIEILKTGYSLVVFPEGTRTRTGAPLPFKPGSLKLATKSGACIVPVTLDGSINVMEGNNYRIKAADIDVTFHPPVFTEGLDAEGLKGLPEKVEGTVVGGLGRKE
jgi:1-acyl-sn-glycerol-3-phosphate acyltransferase